MGNIVNFPTKSIRDWTVIDRSMRSELSRIGVPPGPVQQRIADKMQEFHKLLDIDMNYSIDIAFPPRLTRDETGALGKEIASKIDAIQSERLQAFTNKLFMDRLCREIDACRELGIL